MKNKASQKVFYALFALLISVLLTDIAGKHWSFQLSNVILSQEQISPEIKSPEKEKKKGDNVPCHISRRRMRNIEKLSAASGTLDISPNYCPDSATGTLVITSPKENAKDTSTFSETYKQDKTTSFETEHKDKHERRRRFGKNIDNPDDPFWLIKKGMHIEAYDVILDLTGVYEFPLIYRSKYAKSNKPINLKKIHSNVYYVGVNMDAHRWDSAEGRLVPLYVPMDRDVRAISRNGNYYIAISFPEEVKPLRPEVSIYTLYKDNNERLYDIKTESYARPIISDHGEVALAIGDEMPQTIKFFDNTGMLINEYHDEIGRSIYSDDGNYFAFIGDCYSICQEKPDIDIYFTDVIGNIIWKRNLNKGLYGTALNISPDNKFVAFSIHGKLNTYKELLYVFDSYGKQIIRGYEFNPPSVTVYKNWFLFDTYNSNMYLLEGNTVTKFDLETGDEIWKKEIQIDKNDMVKEEGRYRISIKDAVISNKYKKLFLLIKTDYVTPTGGITGTNILATDLLIYDFVGNQLARQRLYRHHTFSSLALSADENKLNLYSSNRNILFNITSREK